MIWILRASRDWTSWFQGNSSDDQWPALINVTYHWSKDSGLSLGLVWHPAYLRLHTLDLWLDQTCSSYSSSSSGKFAPHSSQGILLVLRVLEATFWIICIVLFYISHSETIGSLCMILGYMFISGHEVAITSNLASNYQLLRRICQHYLSSHLTTYGFVETTWPLKSLHTSQPHWLTHTATHPTARLVGWSKQACSACLGNSSPAPLYCNTLFSWRLLGFQASQQDILVAFCGQTCFCIIFVFNPPQHCYLTWMFCHTDYKDALNARYDCVSVWNHGFLEVFQSNFNNFLFSFKPIFLEFINFQFKLLTLT